MGVRSDAYESRHRETSASKKVMDLELAVGKALAMRKNAAVCSAAALVSGKTTV